MTIAITGATGRFGRLEGLAQATAGWDVGASKGARLDDSRQPSKLINRPITPLSSAVADALKAAK